MTKKTACHRLTPEHALKILKQHDQPSVALFKHGSLLVEMYQPDKIDQQKPHSRDELHVVVSGHGFFVNGASREPFEAGEVLFVAAGVEHRFENFSDDFATWVMFYGPEGGEAAESI